jgi:uncharacterized membrane protein
MASAAKGVIAKARLDALTDGVFAFAMTLLVLNLEFPEDLDPKSTAQLLAAFHEHADALILYVISFFVLGRRWFGQARLKPEPETASYTYARWVLIHLFFITLIPFTTQIVGRYGYPPAVWLYAANVGLAALAALRLSYLDEAESEKKEQHTGRPELALLVAACVLAVVLSLILTDAGDAMYGFFILFASPIVHRFAR